VNLPLDGLDAASLGARMAREAQAAVRIVEQAGLPMTGIEVRFEFDMHYVGQTHTVAVPVPVALINGVVALTEAIARAAFEAAYQTSFSRLLPGIPARIVNLRTAAIGRRPAFDLRALAPEAGTGSAEPRETRPIWFDGAWHDTAIYARLDLPIGTVIAGPAVLEQPDATTVIDPGLVARVDDYGNIIVERTA